MIFFRCLIDTHYYIQNMQVVTVKEEAVLYVLNVLIFIYTQTIVSVNCFIISNTNVAIKILHFTKQSQQQAKLTQRFQLVFSKNILNSSYCYIPLKNLFHFFKYVILLNLIMIADGTKFGSWISHASFAISWVLVFGIVCF